MVLLFILLLLFAIWAAFKFGGVRKVEDKPRDDDGRWSRRKPETEDKPEAQDEPGFRGKGGRFGGGGASGSWGDDDGKSNKRHRD